jgi:hypothetical protein
MISLIPIELDAVTLGKPLPFSLLDGAGQLLAAKGYVIQSRVDLIKLQGRGVSLNVAENEAIFLNKVLVSKIINLMSSGSTLGEIALAEVTAEDKANKLVKKPSPMSTGMTCNTAPIRSCAAPKLQSL